jgi:hypothetical protein
MGKMASHIQGDGHVNGSQRLLAIATKEQIPFASASLIRKSGLEKMLPPLAGTVCWKETQVSVLSHLIPTGCGRPKGDRRYDPQSDHLKRTVDHPSQ